jgi:hypothetical protein
VNTAKRYLLIALTFAIALTTFAIFAPRAVHAITATLVQVVNTSANPVPTAESAVRFQASMCFVNGPASTAYNICPPPTNARNFTVPTVTSTGAVVKRLVVDNVSGTCSNFDNNAMVIKALRLRGAFAPDAVVNGTSTFTHYIPVGPVYSYVNDNTWGPPLAGLPENDYTFGQSSSFAFNAGDNVGLEVVYFLPSASGAQDFFCAAKVEGYLITQ